MANAIDAHSTHDLTENGTIASQTGKVAGARGDYPDTSTYFRNSSIVTLNQSSDYTFSFWIWRNANLSSRSYIFSYGGETQDDYNVRSWISDSHNLHFFIEKHAVMSGNLNISSTSTIPLQTWTHVILTYDGSTRGANIYINNSSDASGTASSDTYINSDNMQVGAVWYQGAHAGSGYVGQDIFVDELGFWSEVISSTDRSDVYNSGSGNSYDNLASGTKTNMVAYYSLDEGFTPPSKRRAGFNTFF